MSDIEKILFTSALTVLGGVFVFVVGQLLLKFFIEPAHELRKGIAAVRHSFLFFAPDILTPIGRTPESSTRVTKRTSLPEPTVGRINKKTVTVVPDNNDGQWRVSAALLNHLVDI